MRFDPDTELYQKIDWYPRFEPSEDDLEAQVAAMEEGLDAYRPGPQDFPDILMGIDALKDQYEVAGGYVGIGVEYKSPAWIAAVASRPDLVERWMEVSAERAIRNVEALKDVDVKVMLGGGDMATNEGPIYSPKAFRELLIPHLRRIVDACHRHGKLYFFASDGNLWPVADDLFNVVDGYYEIDRRAGMDLSMLKQRYPHLRLVGNISSHTLHLGPKQDVVTRRILPGGPQIRRRDSGCSNLIMCLTPEENLFAMLAILRRQD